MVTTAIARELAGFAWAIAKHVQIAVLDALKIHRADIKKRRSSPTTHLSKTEQGWRHGHGQENPRVHYQPDIFRRWRLGRRRLDRGSSATHRRSGGIQPAHQSMINRRFDDRASCPAQTAAILNRSRASKAFLRLRLETANMRVVKIKRKSSGPHGLETRPAHDRGDLS